MLRSVRFWLAVVLVILLACFMIRSTVRSHEHAAAPDLSASDSGDIQTVPPVLTDISAHTAAQLQTDTASSNFTEAESTAAAEPENAPHADQPYLTKEKAEELLGHAAILADLTDYTGWIYVPDSAIDYPVMQGSDNLYYLSHTPDGLETEVGSILLDYRNQRGYTDAVSILYGHNLSSGMFGDLRSYKEPEEFASHKYGWLAAPDMLYRIDFFALSIVSGYDSVYRVPCEQAEWLQKIRAAAMHDSGLEIAPDDRLIALSTCTAENLEQARALFVGRLVPMQQPEDYLHP